MNANFQLLIDNFKQAADPVKAVSMAAYMKNLFPYLGIPKPQRVIIQKYFFNELKSQSIEYILKIVNELWAMPEREFQYIAIEILINNKKKLKEEHILYLEQVITQKSWWDSVDLLAANVVGYYFEKYPHQKEIYLEKWITSGNMWLHRAAIIHQLTYRKKTDVEWLRKAIIAGIESKEFFMQKAIGWALRQYARTNPAWVLEFVTLHHELKPLSKREALKYLK